MSFKGWPKRANEWGNAWFRALLFGVFLVLGYRVYRQADLSVSGLSVLLWVRTGWVGRFSGGALSRATETIGFGTFSVSFSPIVWTNAFSFSTPQRHAKTRD